MKASVIIPTRNRADALSQCLESLARQTIAKGMFEVLVVDNGSTDHTVEVARQHASSLQLAYVSAPEPGLHVGRHEGMRRARSDVLMFADDDIEAGPDWVAAVVEAFAEARVALVGGNNHPLFEAPPPAWLLRWWEQPIDHGRALGHLSILNFGEGRFEIDPGYVWGCNFSIRRDVLLAAGGFHPDAVPKELLRFRGDGETHVSDEVRRSGRRALFDSRASVRHRVPGERMTRRYFEQRAYAQGISDSYAYTRRGARPRLTIAVRLRRQTAGLRSMLVARARIAVASKDLVERELLDIQHAVALAYRQGYQFHQREIAGDPQLLAWVLREDYLK